MTVAAFLIIVSVAAAVSWLAASVLNLICLEQEAARVRSRLRVRQALSDEPVTWQGGVTGMSATSGNRLRGAGKVPAAGTDWR